MSAGYGFLGTCWPAQVDAQAAHCTNAYPVSGSDAAGAYVLSCTGVVTGGLSLVRSDGTGTGAPFTLATVYAPCDTEAIASAVPTPDALGLAFSFGFVGVLICYVTAWGAARVLAAIDL